MKILGCIGRVLIKVLFIIIGILCVLLIGDGTILFDIFSRNEESNNDSEN